MNSKIFKREPSRTPSDSSCYLTRKIKASQVKPAQRTIWNNCWPPNTNKLFSKLILDYSVTPSSTPSPMRDAWLSIRRNPKKNSIIYYLYAVHYIQYVYSPHFRTVDTIAKDYKFNKWYHREYTFTQTHAQAYVTHVVLIPNYANIDCGGHNMSQ